MKKRTALATALWLGLGVFWSAPFVGSASAAEPEPVASSVAPEVSLSGLRRVLSETEKLCNAAKRSYSPQYGRESVASDRGAFDGVEETARLAQEERRYFVEICDVFRSQFQSYSETNDCAAIDSAAFALSEMKYFQPKSPAVAALDERVRSLFSEENVSLEVGESTLAALSRRAIEENIVVNENIRGTQASGNGVVRGWTTLDVRPNPSQAELRVVLDADVTTRTVGFNRGVRVYSDNFGKIVASKSIFWSDSGLLTLPSVSSGSMKTRVNGVDSSYPIMPFNGAIIQNKVAKETPFAERESAYRMNSRVAAQLDAEANRAIVAFNARWRRAREAASEDERMIQKTSSRTDDDRFYFGCVVGKKFQLASPHAALTQASGKSKRDVVSAKPAKRYSSQIAAENRRPDVVFRAHQSAPNNAAFVALAGLTLGDERMFDDLVARFPGADRDEAAKFLEKYRARRAPSDAVVETEKLRFQFEEERPFSVAFEDDKIETTLRFASFEAGGRAWRDVEIRFAYKIVQKETGVAFQRELVDVLPGGLDPQAPIPARFQAFRSVVMKRLESAILDEYLADGFPIRDEQTGETKGTLVPTSATARDGWFEAEFDFQKTPANAEKAGKSVAGRYAAVR